MRRIAATVWRRSALTAPREREGLPRPVCAAAVSRSLSSTAVASPRPLSHSLPPPPPPSHASSPRMPAPSVPSAEPAEAAPLPAAAAAAAFAPNIPPDVLAKVGRNLHLSPRHPLNIVKERIEHFFVHHMPPPASGPGPAPFPASPFRVFDSLPPRVSVRSNFDDLLVPPSHPSRAASDTYYFSAADCLRTHTSAHQSRFLRAGLDSFLVFGDCYRRDEIDASHYPVFHQAEGVRVWQQAPHLTSDWIVADLQRTLDGLVSALFGASAPRRWLDDSFPFTSPSLQVEVQFHGRWLEVLGCGVIQPAICRHFGADVGLTDRQVAGWAFGLGLERLAMVLFDIPDIRLFWSDDPRFHQQFALRATDQPSSASDPASAGLFQPIQFQPFSKYPPCPRDLSFFVPASFHENDLSSVVRSVAGDWVESVQLIESFTHPASGRESRLYRIVYRSMSHSLTNEQVNKLHSQVRQQLTQQINLQLR